jgi:hypothetical protein
MLRTALANQDTTPTAAMHSRTTSSSATRAVMTIEASQPISRLLWSTDLKQILELKTYHPKKDDGGNGHENDG